MDTEELECPICYQVIQIHSKITCGCIFCYECIYRHLLNFHHCPKCLSKNKTIYDINVLSLQINKKFIMPRRLKNNDRTYKKILKEYRIKTDGDLNDLKWRYNELQIVLTIESYKKINKDTNTIAWEIHRKEKSIKRKEQNKNSDKLIEMAKSLHSKFK